MKILCLLYLYSYKNERICDVAILCQSSMSQYIFNKDLYCLLQGDCAPVFVLVCFCALFACTMFCFFLPVFPVWFFGLICCRFRFLCFLCVMLPILFALWSLSPFLYRSSFGSLHCVEILSVKMDALCFPCM